MFKPPMSSGKSARSAARMGWLRHPRAKRMNHLFPILTILAYVLSFGLYVRFLSTGRELTGRLGPLLLGLGLITHYFALWARARGTHTVPYHDLYRSVSLFWGGPPLSSLCGEFFHRHRSFLSLVRPRIVV